jgi:hypothetical protein
MIVSEWATIRPEPRFPKRRDPTMHNLFTHKGRGRIIVPIFVIKAEIQG